MKSFKINLHSVVDLITNSSTVIYTRSDKSDKACREMIDALFKAFGIDKKCEDVFTLSVDYSFEAYENAFERYLDDLDDEDNELCQLEWKERNELLMKIYDDHQAGRPVPEWFDEVLTFVNAGVETETTLTITPKSSEHTDLAQKIVDFLYSTTHEASYN